MESTLPVGAVIGDTFAILRRRWAVFAVLAALLLGLPQALPWAVAALFPDYGGLAQGVTAGAAILGFVFNVAFYGAATHAALAAVEGRPGSASGSLGRGFRLFFGAFAVNLRSGLGIGLATLLLVVPGAMLFCSWAVAMPAYVAEGGIGAAFRRSRALTQGHRWRIFGLSLVYLVVAVVLYLPTLLAAMFPAAGFGTVALTGLQNVALDAASVLAEVGLVALYAALRRMLDGAPGAALAEAFA